MGAGRSKQLGAVALMLAASVSCTAERKDAGRPPRAGVGATATSPAPGAPVGAAGAGTIPVDVAGETAAGRAARADGRPTDAAIHFERAVRADRKAYDARVDLAEVLLEQSIDLRRVRTLLDEAQALRPEEVRPDRLRGWLDELQGDLAAAAADYGRVLAKAPDPELRVRRASLLLRSGQADAAAQELVQAAAERPTDRAVRATLADVYESQGRIAEAEAMLTEVAQLAPSDAAPQRQLAAFYRRHGQLAKAQEAEARARGLEGAPRALRPLRPSRR